MSIQGLQGQGFTRALEGPLKGATGLLERLMGYC